MNGRNRTILILAAVLAVLGGITFWLTSTPAATVTPTPAPTVIVWDNSSATTQGLLVQSMTSTVALQVVGGKWRLTTPLQADADDLQVSQEADQLKKPNATSKVGDNVTDLGQYGLSSPALTVTLVLSGATTAQQQLLVGKPNLDGSAYYVRPATGASVYLVSNSLIEPLKGWLTTPPVAPPTPTPLAPTILPAPPVTGTLTITGTVGVTGPLSSTATITGTAPLSGTNTIISTPGSGPAGTATAATPTTGK